MTGNIIHIGDSLRVTNVLGEYQPEVLKKLEGKQKFYLKSLDYKTTLMSGRAESYRPPTIEQPNRLILVTGPTNELTWLYYKTVCRSFHGTEFRTSTGYSLLPGQRLALYSTYGLGI